MNTRTMKIFTLSTLTGLAAVIVVALVVGGLGGAVAVRAADPLPADVSVHEFGENGLDVDTVRLSAQAEEFEVWTARDRANNVCVVSRATLTHGLASVCASDAQLARAGISSSLQVGVVEDGTVPETVLQVYLLPDSTAAIHASKQVADSQVFGELVIRYGSFEHEESRTIQVSAESGEVALAVFD